MFSLKKLSEERKEFRKYKFNTLGYKGFLALSEKYCSSLEYWLEHSQDESLKGMFKAYKDYLNIYRPVDNHLVSVRLFAIWEVFNIFDNQRVLKRYMSERFYYNLKIN